MALAHADAVCQWRENTLEDEMPPQWMWPFSEEVERHFANVDEARKARATGEESESDMEENELAKGWKR